MAREVKQSVLFRTTPAGTIQDGGGQISFAGWGTVLKRDILSISQIKYRAEVAQVVTVGATSYVPAADTVYAVVVYDPIAQEAGYYQQPRIYSYRTPVNLSNIGATDALRREAIHGELVSKINADTTNHVVAASLGTGTGFTVTDDGGYWPVWSQTMTNVKGISTVYPLTNEDGSGFASNNFSVTTAGVYSMGVGAKLAQENPVVDFVFGNLVSGVLEAPPLTLDNPRLPAVSGQNYDCFVITSLQQSPVVNITGFIAYNDRTQYIFADNGTGSSTANLANYLVFESTMLELISQMYRNDISALYYFTNAGVVCQGLNTGLPSGVAQAVNVLNFGNGKTAQYSPIATSTLVALVATNDGIGEILDATASEGVEVSASTWANSRQSFIVGKTSFSIYTKFLIDDVSGLNPFWVGFRKKEAPNATFTSYTDFAVIGLGNATGDIYTNTEKNSGGNTATDTTNNWADGETHQLEVRVAVDGSVTFFIDGYKPTVTQTFSFDSGDEIIGVFGYSLQTSDIGTPSLKELICVASDSFRS